MTCGIPGTRFHLRIYSLQGQLLHDQDTIKMPAKRLAGRQSLQNRTYLPFTGVRQAQHLAAEWQVDLLIIRSSSGHLLIIRFAGHARAPAGKPRPAPCRAWRPRNPLHYANFADPLRRMCAS